MPQYAQGGAIGLPSCIHSGNTRVTNITGRKQPKIDSLLPQPTIGRTLHVSDGRIIEQQQRHV